MDTLPPPSTVAEYLTHAREYAERDNYSLAFKVLKDAHQAAGQDDSLMAQIEQANRELTQKRNRREEALYQEIDKLLNPPGDYSVENSLAAEERLAILSSLNSAQASELHKRKRILDQDLDETRVYREVLAQCEVYWKQAEADEAAGLNPEDILRRNQAAEEKARQALSQHAEDLHLAALVTRAEQRSQEVRKRFGSSSTLQQTGAFREFLDLLAQETNLDRRIQVADLGGAQRTMTVSEALKFVKNMAADYAHDKAQKYYEMAMRALEAHTPREAERVLHGRRDLHLLPQDDARMLENFSNTKVADELKQLGQAEIHLALAERAASAIEAWNESELAIKAYPWTPRVHEVRPALIIRLATQLRSDLDEAQNALDNNRIAEARTKAQTALDYSRLPEHYISIEFPNIVSETSTRLSEAQQELQEAEAELQGKLEAQRQAVRGSIEREKADVSVRLATELMEARRANVTDLQSRLAYFKEQANRLNGLRADLQALSEHAQTLLQGCQGLEGAEKQAAELERKFEAKAKEIEDLFKTSPGLARDKWEALVAEYTQTVVSRYPGLREVQRQIEARFKVEKVEADLRAMYNVGAAPQLRQAMDQASEAAASNPERREAFNALQLLLAGRYHLRLAQDLRTQGKIDEALAELRKISASEHALADSAQAQQMIQEIETGLAQEENIKRALEEYKRLLPSDPQGAYEAVATYEDTASRQAADVARAIHQARLEWEKRLKAELEALLKTLRHTKTDEADEAAAKVRGIAKILLEKIQTASAVALGKQALARAAAFEAEKDEAADRWEAAAESWQEALTNEPGNAQYTTRHAEAYKQSAYLQLQRQAKDEAASEKILASLSDKFPQDPEVKLWRVEEFLRRARQALSPAEAAARHEMAELTIAQAQADFERRKTPEKDPLRKKAAECLQSVREGQTLTRARQEIERSLGDDRRAQDFRKARTAAEKLITEHKDFPILAEWWDDLNHRTVERLVKRAREMSADQEWERFEPLSKILELDEGHQEAAGILSRLDTLVKKLGVAVDALEQNLKTGSDIRESSDDKVVERQKANLEQLQRHADEALALIDRFGGRLSVGNQAREDLNTYKARLIGYARDLTQFEARKDRALSFLGIAARTAEWRNFEAVLEEIGQSGFGEHRTTHALRDRRNKAREKRQHLERLKGQIETAASEERFAAALRLIQDYRDEKTGDPHDDYGLHGTFRAEELLDGCPIEGLGALERHLREKQAELDGVLDWLSHAGASALSQQRDLLRDKDRATLPLSVVDWAEIEKRIIRFKDEGAFDRAQEMLALALDGRQDGREAGLKGMVDEHTLSLREAHARLNPPLDPLKTDSRVARDLVLAAATFRQELADQITRAADRQQWLAKQKEEWEFAWANYRAAEMEQRESQRWTERLRNPLGYAHRLQEAEVVMNERLITCRAICPAHPKLRNL